MQEKQNVIVLLVALVLSATKWISTDGFVMQSRFLLATSNSYQSPSTGITPPPAPVTRLLSSTHQDNGDQFIVSVDSNLNTPDDTHTVKPAATNSSFILYRPEEEEETCLPPGRLPEVKLVFLISDATGVTARSTLFKTLAQFDTCADENSGYASSSSSSTETHDGASMVASGTCDVRMRTFTFIRSTQALSQILETAQQKNACVMYTLADPTLRLMADQFCRARNIPYVDLMGRPLDVLSQFLDKEPLGIPARLSQQTRRRSYLGDSYYQRIDAVEFALKADDGQAPWLLPEADIVLVGVSRSGKTPLSVVLSQTMSLKVANIPLVMEVAPPKELEQVDPQRVYCLTIAPSELRKIRASRLERRGIRDMEAKMEQMVSTSSGSMGNIAKSNYADRNYLMRDLNHARSLSGKYNWTEIDVTGRAVEETASYIVEIFNRRFETSIGTNHLG